MSPVTGYLSKRRLRIAFAVAMILFALSPLNSYVAYATNPQSEVERQAQLPYEQRTPMVNGSTGITVATAHGEQGAPRFAGELMAWDAEGKLLYYNDSLDSYFDVDPIPNTSATVVYIAGNRMEALCGVIGGRKPCKLNIIEKINLTTGDVTRVFSRVGQDTTWHDVDRLNETHYLVADIDGDRVYIIDVTNEAITWEWSVKQHFDPMGSGGSYPNDWTHLNDVEVTTNGLVMVSLRNQDQVIFIDPGRGLLTNWTLGADDRRDILYEQHNPDYIPRDNGGPAVIVADTENNRIIEFQRTGEQWQKSWVWMDRALQWPRDADRLPNGHTLITDTHGSRVIEVDRQGRIVWKAKVFGGYEAERLGTGDESKGGPSAAELGLPSRKEGENDYRRRGNRSIWFAFTSTAASALSQLRELLPSILVNTILYIRPRWMSSADLVFVTLFSVTAAVWAGFEARWSSFIFRYPVIRREED